MKKITVHEWGDMLLSLFQMDAGDKIDRHKHPFSHTTGVARGSSKVTIWHPDGVVEIMQMEPGARDFPFPPNLYHEIEAIEDGTIIVNLSRPSDHAAAMGIKPAAAGQDGGIAFDDP